MTQNTGATRQASRYGPISGKWLQEEFDDVGRDLKDTKAISVPEAHAEDAAARMHEWRDETDYDDQGAASGCWERPTPFPDNHDLIVRDEEKKSPVIRASVQMSADVAPAEAR